MITIRLGIELKNNFTMPARINRKQALLGDTYKVTVSREKDIWLLMEGGGLEPASFARHAVDVYLRADSLSPVALPFHRINTTKRLG